MDDKLQTGDVKWTQKDRPFFRFLDNFWYHYKWQTLIVLVLVIFLSVSVAQCAKKQSYDLYVLYAGPYEISGTAEGELSEREEMINALATYAPDRDGNGQKSVAFEPLYVLTDEAKSTADVNVSRLSEDTEILSSELLYSNYYICFLSENVYKSRQNQDLFVKFADYSANESLESVDAYAVRLSSLRISTLPGFDALPDDTVVVLRKLSEVAQKTNGVKNKEIYAAAETAFSALLR